jgi:hypothetical protein
MTVRPFRKEVARSPFATTGLACFLAFTVIGLFLTLIPAYVVFLSYSANLLLAGSAVALVLACSMLVQLAGYRRPTRDLEGHGLPLLATGLLLLAIAGAISSLPSCSSRQPQRESGRAWCSSAGSPAWPVLMRYRRTGATSLLLAAADLDPRTSIAPETGRAHGGDREADTRRQPTRRAYAPHAHGRH